MEEQLIELLLAAKKALSTGQSIGEQANILSQQTEQYTDVIEKTWPKLIFVHNHILVQLSTLDRVREFLIMKIQTIRTIIKEREATFEKVSFDLQFIFDLLRSCVIDKGILEFNQPTNNKNDTENVQQNRATLFDYIQDQAVLELQQHADDEIGQVEMLCSSMETLSKQLLARISDLATMQENALSVSLDEPTATFINEKAHIQETEMANMADILTSLTNHYDQLGEATRICQANPENELDITVLLDDHDHLPDILNDLHESLYIVSSVNEEIQVRMQIYSTIQKDLIKVLEHLDQFSAPNGLADIISEKVNTSESEMKQHQDNLDHYFEQLTSLTEWYRQFTYSYHHLIVEVERRLQIQEKQEKLKKELIKSLDDSYQDELQKRQRWITEHGQYLPQDLCAFIFDPPSKLTVVQEHEPNKLPILSDETIEKAINNVNQQAQI
ncbi:unnamed protein product [Cunninghamella blakesleeana]